MTALTVASSNTRKRASAISGKDRVARRRPESESTHRAAPPGPRRIPGMRPAVPGARAAGGRSPTRLRSADQASQFLVDTSDLVMVCRALQAVKPQRKCHHAAGTRPRAMSWRARRAPFPATASDDD
jgi:hypothetical protein